MENNFPTAEQTRENTKKLSLCDSPEEFMKVFKEIGNLNAIIVALNEPIVANIFKRIYPPTMTEKSSWKKFSAVMGILAASGGFMKNFNSPQVIEIVAEGRHNYEKNERTAILEKEGVEKFKHGDIDFENKTIYLCPNFSLRELHKSDLFPKRTQDRRDTVHCNNIARSLDTGRKRRTSFDFDMQYLSLEKKEKMEDEFYENIPVVERSHIVWNGLLYCRIISAFLNEKPVLCKLPNGTMAKSTPFGPDYLFDEDEGCMVPIEGTPDKATENIKIVYGGDWFEKIDIQYETKEEEGTFLYRITSINCDLIEVPNEALEFSNVKFTLNEKLEWGAVFFLIE